jgi:hypothetical protein
MRDPRPGLPWSQGRVVRRAEYGSYMGSPAWFARRERWLAEWKSTHGDPVCLVCGQPWALRSGDLHHRTYTRLGAEAASDLTPLCRTCHTELHRLLEGAPGWRRMPREQATDALVAVLRAHLIEAGREASHE